MWSWLTCLFYYSYLWAFVAETLWIIYGGCFADNWKWTVNLNELSIHSFRHSSPARVLFLKKYEAKPVCQLLSRVQKIFCNQKEPKLQKVYIGMSKIVSRWNCWIMMTFWGSIWKCRKKLITLKSVEMVLKETRVKIVWNLYLPVSLQNDLFW